MHTGKLPCEEIDGRNEPVSAGVLAAIIDGLNVKPWLLFASHELWRNMDAGHRHKQNFAPKPSLR